MYHAIKLFTNNSYFVLLTILKGISMYVWNLHNIKHISTVISNIVIELKALNIVKSNNKRYLKNKLLLKQLQGRKQIFVNYQQF